MTGKGKGQHPHNKLTAATVRNAKGPAFLADGNGLYLKVDATGARRWVQRLVIDRKRKDIALGPAAIVTLVEAREAAIENKRLIRAGIDPAHAKKEAEAIPTFQEAARTVHGIHKPTWRNVKHAAQFISTLETYAFPAMGSVSVASLNGADILKALQPIWLEKPETARRVKQRIDLVMRWVIAKGWRTDNPSLTIAEALPKQDKTIRQHRKALPYTQVAICIRSVNESRAAPLSKLAFECLVLTASRSGEVRLAEWSELDLETGIWVIPKARMKMKRAHSIPLVPRVVEIFKTAQVQGDGSDLVFPSARRGRPLSDATLLKLVRSKGYDCDIHGFRASFRTWAEENSSAPHKVAEAALAHSKGDETERAYMRSDLFEKRRTLMGEWADYLLGKNSSGIVA
jgi:integrase